MALPPELLQAISSPGGGKIALVLGAGCSVEAPTNIPVSRICSNEIHRRLIDDGVLNDGDCSDPDDLSALADAVFRKRNSQRDVVERLRDSYGLKLATPNSGYWIAAALLCEGALSSVVTLNYDLALSTALAALGAGKIVGVIERPEDLSEQKTLNVYYLHRNANAANMESWILRTAALDVEWRGHWEQIIATKVLAAPVVVFAGLGTPVAVLIESTKLLRNALPAATKLYQADPGNIADSKFFQELSLDPSAYIQCGWGQLMEELSQRLTKEQIAELQQAAGRKTREENLTSEDLTSLLNDLKNLGIVKFGKLRSEWLLHDKPYRQFEAGTIGLLADLLLAIATMARISGAQAVIVDNSSVEFRRDGRVVASFIIASGCGHHGKQAVEARVETRRGQYRNCVVSTDSPPYTLVATEEANVVDAFRVRLGLTTDQSVPGAKCMVPVPRGIQVGVSSVRTTDSNI
jgi:hypothetical protein